MQLTQYTQHQNSVHTNKTIDLQNELNALTTKLGHEIKSLQGKVVDQDKSIIALD